MLLIGAAVVLALTVLPPAWGLALVAGTVALELTQTAFWYRYTRRYPVSVGREALLGQAAEVLEPCRPVGWIRVHGERWRARCRAGDAGRGDAVVVEGVEGLTLVVSPAANALAQSRLGVSS